MLPVVIAAAVAGPPRAALGTTASLTRTWVQPGAPIELYLSMQNRTDKILTFETHAHPTCYLLKFVDVSLRPDAPMKVPPDCSNPPIRKVSPNEKVTMLADLREVFELEDRDYTVSVAWKDGGPEIYSPLTAIPGLVRVGSPVYTGRITKGGTITLPDKSTMVFVGHTSLPSARRGEPPMLVIDTVQRVPGSGETPRSATLALDTMKEFDFGTYKVTLANHQFDQWMDVVVFSTR